MVELGDNPPAVPKRVMVGLLAETPIHVGIGQVSGTIDLPIAREATTGYPVLPASSLKGALRDKARQVHMQSLADKDCKHVSDLFGPETAGEDANDAAGSVLIGDGKLLLLPIRSLERTFVWVTCPFVLKRLKRDAVFAGETLDLQIPSDDDLTDAGNYKAKVAQDGGNLSLEELLFRTEVDPQIATTAHVLLRWFPEGGVDIGELTKRLVLIPDRAFAFFCAHAIPARQRNALDKKTKTVVDGALWSEEALAPDTLFYTLWADRFGASAGVNSLCDLFAFAAPRSPYLQVGGKETIGHGWFKVQHAVTVGSDVA